MYKTCRVGKKKGLENIVLPAVILIMCVVLVVMCALIIEKSNAKYERIMDIEDALTSTQTELYSLLNFNQCPTVEVKYVECIINGDVDLCNEREEEYEKDRLKSPLSKWIGIAKAQNDRKLPVYGYDAEEGYNKVIPIFVAYESGKVPSKYIDLERCLRTAMQASQTITDIGRRITIPALDIDICVDSSTDFDGECTDAFDDLCQVSLTYDAHVAAYSETFEDILISYYICT